MKKIWGYLKSHLIHDFDKREYLLTGTLLVAGLSLNYTFDFEDDILDEQTGLFKFFCYYLFYALPFYAVLSFQRNLERNFWKDKMFWIKSQFGLVILATEFKDMSTISISSSSSISSTVTFSSSSFSSPFARSTPSSPFYYKCD